ncbi:type II toxin-antitoxin system VapC family toxin [Castellaniella sp.]|uniref:type II toxin-antitoxin system VapC family toxin n=1 Tax=Castellaniella sp. TaxID=1955812 RepID=UPI003C75EA2C
MIRYLLDTNAVIAVLKEPHGPVSRRLRKCDPEEVAISSLVMHELFYGAFRSQRVTHNLAVVDSLQFQVLEFDQEDARYAGEIRAQLARQGTPIGAYDVLIAGQARARTLCLVTRNVREFDRVSGLNTENWQSD